MTRFRSYVRTLLLSVLVGLGTVVLLPGSASASITQDCANGSIPKGRYTSAQLQSALDKLDGGLADYSDCADNIYRALQDAAATKKPPVSSGKGTGTTTSDGTTPPSAADSPAAPDPLDVADAASPEEQEAAVTEARKVSGQGTSAKVMQLDDAAIPTEALQLSSSGEALPTPLIVTLLAVAAAGLLAGAYTVVQTVRRRRGS